MVLCMLLTPMAHRFGLLDHPSDRKVHRSSIPLVGGLAIYIALVIATTVANTYAFDALPLLAACALMLVTLNSEKPIPDRSTLYKSARGFHRPNR